MNEDRIIAAMANADPSARQGLVGRLAKVRSASRRRQHQQALAEAGFDAISHLGHGAHIDRDPRSEGKNWLDPVLSMHETDNASLRAQADIEAKNFVMAKADFVALDADEYAIQAQGHADWWGNKFGTQATFAKTTFLTRVSELSGIEMTAAPADTVHPTSEPDETIEYDDYFEEDRRARVRYEKGGSMIRMQAATTISGETPRSVFDKLKEAFPAHSFEVENYPGEGGLPIGGGAGFRSIKCSECGIGLRIYNAPSMTGGAPWHVSVPSNYDECYRSTTASRKTGAELDDYLALIEEHFGTTDMDDISADLENAIRGAMRAGEDVGPYLSTAFEGPDGRIYGRFASKTAFGGDPDKWYVFGTDDDAPISNAFDSADAARAWLETKVDLIRQHGFDPDTFYVGTGFPDESGLTGHEGSRHMASSSTYEVRRAADHGGSWTRAGETFEEAEQAMGALYKDGPSTLVLLKNNFNQSVTVYEVLPPAFQGPEYHPFPRGSYDSFYSGGDESQFFASRKTAWDALVPSGDAPADDAMSAQVGDMGPTTDPFNADEWVTDAMPMVATKTAADWDGQLTPGSFCRELQKYDDLWNTGGREHASSCPVHGGPNAEAAFAEWKATAMGSPHAQLVGLSSLKTATFTFDLADVDRGYDAYNAGHERLPGERHEWLIGYDAAEEGRTRQEAYEEAEAAWDSEESMYGHDWHGWREGAKVANGLGTCEVCGGPGDMFTMTQGGPCMSCVRARANTAQNGGKCRCGRKAIPGPEAGGGRPGARSWIPCERCLGVIRQTGSHTAARRVTADLASVTIPRITEEDRTRIDRAILAAGGHVTSYRFANGFRFDVDLDSTDILRKVTGMEPEIVRIASKTALISDGVEHQCTVCGRPADYFAFQDGARASGYFACEEHVDRFREGRTVERITAFSSKTAATIVDRIKRPDFTYGQGDDEFQLQFHVDVLGKGNGNVVVTTHLSADGTSWWVRADPYWQRPVAEGHANGHAEADRESEAAAKEWISALTEAEYRKAQDAAMALYASRKTALDLGRIKTRVWKDTMSGRWNWEAYDYRTGNTYGQGRADTEQEAEQMAQAHTSSRRVANDGRSFTHGGVPYYTGIASPGTPCAVCGQTFDIETEAYVSQGGDSMICRWCGLDILRSTTASRRTAGITINEIEPPAPGGTWPADSIYMQDGSPFLLFGPAGGEYLPVSTIDDAVSLVLARLRSNGVSDFTLNVCYAGDPHTASRRTAGLYPDENASGVTTWADGYGNWHATADSEDEAIEAILARNPDLEQHGYNLHVELVEGRHYVEASRRTAGTPFTTPTACTSCGKDMMEIDAFPGNVCLDCYADSPEGRRMPTAEEVVEMWGGPVRRSGSTEFGDTGSNLPVEITPGEAPEDFGIGAYLYDEVDADIDQANVNEDLGYELSIDAVHHTADPFLTEVGRYRELYDAIEPRPSRFDDPEAYAEWAARADAWAAEQRGVTASRHTANWPEINSADEARDFAIEWSYGNSDRVQSWGDVADEGAFFEELVRRFPELAEEFAENGFISLGSRHTAADGDTSFCRLCGQQLQRHDYAWYALKGSPVQRDVGQHYCVPARLGGAPGEFDTNGQLVPGTPGGGGGQYDAPAGTIYDAGGNAIKVARRSKTGSIYDYPEGTTAVCAYCDEPILLDQREGGGPGKDWGARPEDWVGNGGIGMDYGCGGSPESSDEGTGGHLPMTHTIQLPTHVASHSVTAGLGSRYVAVARRLHGNEISMSDGRKQDAPEVPLGGYGDSEGELSMFPADEVDSYDGAEGAADVGGTGYLEVAPTEGQEWPEGDKTTVASLKAPNWHTALFEG